MIINNFITTLKKDYNIITILIDITIVSCIIILPIISHSYNIPFYLIEPMRLAVVFILFVTCFLILPKLYFNGK